MKKISLLGLLVLFFFYSPVFASPIISSFTVSNSSINSGQLMSLSWSGVETGGYNLSVSCVTGVKVKYQSGGVYSCDTKIATSNQVSDNLAFYVTNVSGTSKTVTFRLYPKSTDGTENTDGVRVVSMTVAPAPYPISSVSPTSTSTTMGLPVNISWASTDLDGVNIIFSCADNVSVYSGSVDTLPLVCGSLAFSDKLSANSNLNIYFKNKGSDRANITARILPYIGDGAYDLTHAQTITFDVDTDKTFPTQLLSFLASQPKVSSGDTFSVSWTTKYATGVNLKFDCTDSLTFSFATSSGGQNVSCGVLASENSLNPNSSASIVIQNSSKDSKIAYISLLPQITGGGFDGVNSRKIPVVVSPKGEVVIFDGKTPVVSSSTVSTSSSNSGKIISPRKKFYKVLGFGSRGDDVSALQEFLSKNGYYPEGLVTGYLGNATVKAIKKFQEQNGIAKLGQAGYGSVGPMTRSKLNSL